QTSPINNGKRFRSSWRYTHIKCGTRHNGTALQAPPDMFRKFGIIPYIDLPFEAQMTDDQYFNPPDMAKHDALGAEFLARIGGRDAIQYHWVSKNGGGGTPIT